MSLIRKFDLTGRTAIVTGASKGLGKSMAAAFLEQGANVVVSSRKWEACDEVATELRSLGGHATGIACHMGSSKQIERLVEKTMETYGSIDIVVNNAATNPVFGALEDAEEKIFDKIMAINVKGPWELSKRALPHLKENMGCIINISSIEGITPGLGLGLYRVSKSSLIQLTKVMAREWGKIGVRANVICPGLVETKFSEALTSNQNIMEYVMGRQALDMLAKPDDVAGLALFLASPASKFITGGVYTADGGYTI